MPEVSGSIVFGADLKPFAGATVYVRLEDVVPDAPAALVAETVLRHVQAGGQGPTSLEFAIDAPPLDPRKKYVVRVKVYVDADGQLNYSSTAYHEVKAGVEAARLLIPVQRVS
jgi:uncharacterized lipoprotein YbaY